MEAITKAADEETKRTEEREKIMSDTGATPSGPRYPEVVVQLTGQDGNAYAIMGQIRKALKSHLQEHGYTPEVIATAVKLYFDEATAGDYDNLLRVTMRTINCN